MNLVIDKVIRANEDTDEEIVDNFSYEFFEEDTKTFEDSTNQNNINNNKNIKQKLSKNNINFIKKEKNNESKDKNNDMIIDFDDDNIEKNNTDIHENDNININNQNYFKKNDTNDRSKMNYSLDQEDIIEILNLNQDNNNSKENNLNYAINDDLENILLEKLNAKLLVNDLLEKKNQLKNAYNSYSLKLKETMNNDYIKNMLETSSKNKHKNKNKIKNDYLIHQQTNTINDINIFCLNNNNNSNILNINNKADNQNSEISFNNNKKVNIINYELNINTNNSIALDIFLKDYNDSIQKRTFQDMKENPDLNYEIYIDILNDLKYIDISISPQIYFLNSSIYKYIWNFMGKIQINKYNTNFSYNNDNEIDDNFLLKSNTLLIFLLTLNKFFNSISKLSKIQRELNWLKIENYQKFIINEKYIQKNFGQLNEIRDKNKKNLIIDREDFNDKKIRSVEISNTKDDIISDYFKSYANNNNDEINNYIKNISNIKTRNYSATKLNASINGNKSTKNKIKFKQIYAFKPRIKNININMNKVNLKTRKYSPNYNRINKYSNNSSINNDNIISLNKSGCKLNNKKAKINYKEYSNLSHNDINKNLNNSENNFINKIISDQIYENSNSRSKSGKYYNKIKQNRTDLIKLFNNKYSEGTINEKYEEIKRQRENNSKSKGNKIKINYENITNVEKNENDNENNKLNKKRKYQFKKKNNYTNDINNNN